MLNRIASKLIHKQIDLKDHFEEECSYDQLDTFIRKQLGIEGDSGEESKDESKDTMRRKAPKEFSQEEIALRDTLDYIMNNEEYISYRQLTGVLADYLSKQRDSMKVMFRLKKFMKYRESTLEEVFNSYKSQNKFKNTDLHPDEYMTVMSSIKFEVSKTSICTCLDTFETSSKEKVDYMLFCQAVADSIDPRAKGLRNLRKYHTENEIYEHIASQCSDRFAFGSLLKDHDYKNNGTIETRYLLRILRKCTPDMTEGDIQFLIGKTEDKETQ